MDVFGRLGVSLIDIAFYWGLGTVLCVLTWYLFMEGVHRSKKKRAPKDLERALYADMFVKERKYKTDFKKR